MVSSSTDLPILFMIGFMFEETFVKIAHAYVWVAVN